MADSPTEMADKEINKRLAKAIASRKLEVRKLKAKVKKIEEEISKIESGELIPEESDEDSIFHSSPRREIIPTRQIIGHPRITEGRTYWFTTSPSTNLTSGSFTR